PVEPELIAGADEVITAPGRPVARHDLPAGEALEQGRGLWIGQGREALAQRLRRGPGRWGGRDHTAHRVQALTLRRRRPRTTLATPGTATRHSPHTEKDSTLWKM